MHTVTPLCQQHATVLVQCSHTPLHDLIPRFREMNLCSEKIPIRYCQLQARLLLLLVWKE